MRDLKLDEIECKIAIIKEDGCSLLLYKTARTDMQLLDEIYGEMNWQCEYKEIKGNMYCGISVYNPELKEWITKWDCGIESAFGDKEKGEASDAFKRAGFKWGIGIELYTSPFIWVNANKCNIKQNIRSEKSIFKCSDKFEATKIKIQDKKIIELEIINKTKKMKCFYYNEKQIAEEIEEVSNLIKDSDEKILQKLIKGLETEASGFYKDILEKYNIKSLSQLTKLQYGEVLHDYKALKGE